jgi:hypothetical protein
MQFHRALSTTNTHFSPPTAAGAPLAKLHCQESNSLRQGYDAPTDNLEPSRLGTVGNRVWGLVNHVQVLPPGAVYHHVHNTVPDRSVPQMASTYIFLQEGMAPVGAGRVLDKPAMISDQIPATLEKPVLN